MIVSKCSNSTTVCNPINKSVGTTHSLSFRKIVVLLFNPPEI